MKWPSFEQLGRDFYDNLKPALDQITADAKELDELAARGVARIEHWLEAPCYATVKLDGTNVGVDETGLMVGRNKVIEPGATYHKVDVTRLLSDCPVKTLRDVLARAAGKEAIAKVMLYGELVVNCKHDYMKADIFKQWLCFGAVLRPASEDGEAPSRLAGALRASGYNASKECNGDAAVTITPNVKLAEVLRELRIPTVADAYRPPESITAAEWAEHDGVGSLLYFRSLRRLIHSDWARRFLLPVDSTPLGEGIVVASESDGRLFKWKHASEDLGHVPEQLEECVLTLQRLAPALRAALLPQGLLEVCEQLHRVATAKTAEVVVVPKSIKTNNSVDQEALAVWTSALTKFDALEAAFESGETAQKVMERDLIDQIAKDLVHDYDANVADVKQRATRVVRIEMGKRFGLWKRSQADGA